MSIQVGTPLILRGFVDDKPELPDGWVYRETWANWLFAIAPNGKEYYVSKEKLYRAKKAGAWDVIRTFIANRGHRRFRLGQQYIDTREVIQL